jgi:two-component system sensor histidine kinase UhpB
LATQLNLKLRLNLITTGLLLLLMLAGIMLSFNNARMNTLAEIASAEKSTLTLFNSALIGAASSNSSADKAKINNSRINNSRNNLSTFKLRQLSHMRHLKIELVDNNNRLLDSNQLTSADKLSHPAPIWFVRILNNTMPKWQPTVREFYVKDQLLGKLVITPDPSYEYAEIWKQMTELLVLLALFFICVNLMIAWAIAQALKPTESILQTLNALEKGDLAARLPHFKLPELSLIGKQFNHMIETLQHSISQNHKLAQRLITLQEAERKNLARDLHDEFGQCLTAINTDANVILKHAKIKYPELLASATAITKLSRHLGDLVSGLLQKLRPGVLDELGLIAALNDLVDTWKSRNESQSESRSEAINCRFSIKVIEDNLTETINLAIYRLVQEALTNISRHAKASIVTIEIAIETDAKNRRQQTGVMVKINDNGVGFNPNNNDGFGLPGMRERVEGLGGTLTIETRLKHGTTLTAWVPLTR